MLHRRVLGALTALAMLQIVLAASGFVCPQHVGEPGATHATMDGVAHQHGAKTGHHRAPKNGPSAPDCCQAMTTCSATFTLTSVFAGLLPAGAHVSAIAGASVLAASRVSSPDPPPPRD